MDMPNVSLTELLDFLEENTSTDKFQVAYGLVRHQGSWRLLNCVISFVGPTSVGSIVHTYGDRVALVREVIPSGLTTRLREIVDSKTFEIVKFSVKETVSVRDQIEHHESGYETTYLGGRSWPFFDIEMDLPNRINPWHWETIASQDSPVFPGRNAAMNYITGFSQENWEYIPVFMAPLQDFRGRIDHVEIDGPKIRVKVKSLKLGTSDLSVKMYAASDKDITLSEGLEPDKSGWCDFNGPEPIMKVGISLLEKRSEMPIDAAEWSSQRPSRKFEVKGGTGLESLVTQGESETVEYKVDIDKYDREEFMETLSSFANTSSGVIVLGVNDQLEIVGFERKKEDIARIIDDGMDLVPPYRIEEANYRGKRLLLVYVEKGSNPPYMSRRTKKAYGRRRGNDYFLSSAEIRNLVLGSDQSHR
jgi:hypothetical protein